MVVWRLQREERLRQPEPPEPMVPYSAALTTTLIWAVTPA